MGSSSGVVAWRRHDAISGGRYFLYAKKLHRALTVLVVPMRDEMELLEA